MLGINNAIMDTFPEYKFSINKVTMNTKKGCTVNNSKSLSSDFITTGLKSSRLILDKFEYKFDCFLFRFGDHQKGIILTFNKPMINQIKYYQKAPRGQLNQDCVTINYHNAIIL